MTEPCFTILEEKFYSLYIEFQNQNRIKTENFLEAFHSIAYLIELLGKAFWFAKADIQSKIHSVEQIYKKDSYNFATIEQIVFFELNSTLAFQAESASRNILRLLRALDFAYCFLKNLFENPYSPLKELAKMAYEKTLAEHHSWPMRHAVSLAMLTIPSREQFIERIGLEEKRSQQEIHKLIQLIKPILTELSHLYTENNMQNLP